VTSIMAAAYSWGAGQSNHAESAFRAVRFVSLWLGPSAPSITLAAAASALKLEVLRTVLPVVIGLVIPLFYLLIYLASAGQRLRSLEAQCQQSWADLIERLGRHQRAWSEQLDATFPPSSAEAHVSRTKKALSALTRLLVEAERDASGSTGAPLAAAVEEVELALRALAEAAAREGGSALAELEGSGQTSFTSAVAEHNQVVARYLAFRRTFAGRLLSVLLRSPPRAPFPTPTGGVRDVRLGK
jgi:hypothetical protein